MAQYTIAHVLTVEDRLQKITNNAYELALQNAWWDKVMTTRPSTGLKELYEWLLTTADIVELPKGQMVYEDIATVEWTIKNAEWGKALQIQKYKWKSDQFGFASDWASQIGSNMALRPQYAAVDLLANAESATLGKCYDGLAFFHAAHPVHPYDASMGTFRNLVTTIGQLDGTGNAGAPELTVDNFTLAVALMQSYKMPNGRNRNLRPKYLATGPKRRKAAVEVTGARFISATENVVASSYNVEPFVVNEITDNSWYLIAESTGSNLGGPFIYQVHTPFEMNSYTGVTQAELNRSRMVEWQVEGFMGASYGLPYHMIKMKVA